MKIVLAPSGTLGDVRPGLALAVALRDAGHNVLLCGPPEFEMEAEKYKCPFRVLGRNLRESAKSVPEPALHMFAASKWLVRYLKTELEIQVRQLAEIIRGADLLIASSLNLGAHTVAEAFGIRYAFLVFVPQMFPSAFYPSFLTRRHDLPKWINCLTWKMSDALWNLQILPVLNRLRREMRLPPISDFVNHWLGDRIIVAVDAPLGVVPPDVSRQFTQCGSFDLPIQGGLNEEISSFLESGDHPVYAGFGSMIHEDPRGMTDLIINAARKVRRRVLISRGWAGLGDSALSKDCYVTDNVPHALLFPRVAAVVHHGGSGTVAAAARAGVPQIIVPHMSDQFYWGHRIPKLGLGPPAIWRSRITSDRLAKAIHECLSDHSYQKAAREMAATLAKQPDSLQQAVRVLSSEC